MIKVIYHLFVISLFIIIISHSGADDASSKEWTSFTTENDLYSNVVTSIAVDLDNIKWVGHQIGHPGISVFDDKEWFTFYQYYDRSDYHFGRVIAVDKNNVKWLSSDYDVVSYDYKYDARPYIVRTLLEEHKDFWTTEPLVGGYIIDIIVDDNNIKWVVGQGDTHFNAYVAQYDGVTVIHRDIFNTFILDFVRRNDNIQWVSLSGGMSYYDGTQWNLLSTKDGIPAKAFHILAFDKNGILWAGNYDDDSGREIFTGLASFDGATWKTYKSQNSSIPSDKIYCIAVDYNNIKWIGTDAGVARFDGETWTVLNSKNSGLCNDKVNAIAFEKNNTIWFGTDNGVSRYTGEVIEPSDVNETKPEALPMLKSFPNPFNPSTTIEFTLPETELTTLTIYNMAGQKIRELASDRMTAGTHRLQWDGKDSSGSPVSAGIYIARLKAGEITATGKLVLVK